MCRERPEGNENRVGRGAESCVGWLGPGLGGTRMRPGGGRWVRALLPEGPRGLTSCLGQALALALGGHVSKFISALFSFRAAFELGLCIWGEVVDCFPMVGMGCLSWFQEGLFLPGAHTRQA